MGKTSGVRQQQQRSALAASAAEPKVVVDLNSPPRGATKWRDAPTGASLGRRIGKLRADAVFTEPGWHVWCGTAVRTPDGRYHMLYSRWPEASGHDGWVTRSEIARAESDSALGPYRPTGVALAGAGGDAWDADVTHNPTMLEFEGKYYLYYMGNRGNGEYWDNRNHQRVGVAVADHPAGPWRRLPAPALDASSDPRAWDCTMTSNPTVCRGPDGRFLMLYKGVGPGPAPKHGAVNCGVAFASHPLGPWVKHPGPVIRNPEHDWAVEDPFVWCEGRRYLCIVKDFQGYFARSEKNVLVLFESFDGIDWRPAPDPLIAPRSLTWEDGRQQRVEALERPQLLFEEGRATALLLACAFDPERRRSANIQLPLDPAD